MLTCTIGDFKDLERFGIDCLTGEACGLNMRLLCDLTEQGHKIVCEYMGLPLSTKFSENWNSGRKDNPHIASVMLTHECFQKLAVFCLKRSGYVLAAMMKNGTVIGLGEAHSDEDKEAFQRWLDYFRQAPLDNRDIKRLAKRPTEALKKLYDDNPDNDEIRWAYLDAANIEDYCMCGADVQRLVWLKENPLRNTHAMSGRTE